MITTFLLCRRCNVLHPMASAEDPIFADDEAGAELHAFRAAHAAHGLDAVERIPEDALFDRPTADPMATRWFHVAAGCDVLLVRSWRATIDEPRRYELEATAPAVEAPVVDIDELLLRRSLDRHFFPHALRPAMLERFVETVRQLVERLDGGEVEISFDDVTVPNAGIGPLPDALCEALLARCHDGFDVWELERLRSFISAHRHEDGALAVRVRRTVVPRAA